MVQTFVLKVQHTNWQKDWTLMTSSEKLTQLTCVNMDTCTTFVKVVLQLLVYNHKNVGGSKIFIVFQYVSPKTSTTDFKHFECENLLYHLLNFKMFDDKSCHI